MLNIFKKKSKNEIKTMIYTNEDKTSTVALMAFDGDIKNRIISQFNNNYLIEGDHIKNGGISSKAPILSLLGAGSSLGLSSLLSKGLFVASANPATLMAMKGGVGSAVLAGGRIVEQAAFHSAAGAILPIAAPLLVFQAITTIAIMNQFKNINERFDRIGEEIGRIQRREEAECIGEALSIHKRIIDIENEFSICNRFTNSMIIRLALIENRVNPIFEKYSYLFSTKVKDKNIKERDLQFRENDAMMSILLSILDLKTDIIRLKLAIQENPGYLDEATKALVQKVDDRSKLFKEISDSKYELSTIADDIRETINGLNWWQKNIPWWALGKRGEKKEGERKADRLKDKTIIFSTIFDPEVKDGLKILENIKMSISSEDEKYMDLIYWTDEKGEHSYYTDDLKVVPAYFNK